MAAYTHEMRIFQLPCWNEYDTMLRYYNAFLLLSWMRAEIYVSSYLLPVNGRHLWYTTYSDIRQYSHQSLRVTHPQKHGFNRWNFVAIMYRSLDIPCMNVDKCISGLTAAILNFWVISTYFTVDKDFLEFTQQNTWHTTLFYSAISRISGLFTTILLILDEFHQSKLLIWRHAYCGHVMLRSWNQCCPIENLFVHKVIKMFYHIS